MMGADKKESNDPNPMMKMLGSFTVLRLTTLLSAAEVKVTKEQLLDLNSKLNEIKQED